MIIFIEKNLLSGDRSVNNKRHAVISFIEFHRKYQELQ